MASELPRRRCVTSQSRIVKSRALEFSPFEVASMRKLIGAFLLLGLMFTAVPAQGETKIALIAGRPSHGPGDHEFNAGTKLLVNCLKDVSGVNPVFVAGGWPEDESVFDGAKSVVFFMD